MKPTSKVLHKPGPEPREGHGFPCPLSDTTEQASIISREPKLHEFKWPICSQCPGALPLIRLLYVSPLRRIKFPNVWIRKVFMGTRLVERDC